MVSTGSKHILTFIRYDKFHANYIKIKKTKVILFGYAFFLQYSAKFNAQMIIVKLSKLAIKEGVAHFRRVLIHIQKKRRQVTANSLAIASP